MENFEGAFDYLLTAPYPWLALTVLVLLGLLWLSARRQPKSLVAFKSQTGRVMVSRVAINELTQRVCDSIDVISKSLIRIKTRGGTLKLIVEVELLSDSKLSEVSQELQNRLFHTFRDNLSIEKVGHIDIVVNGLREGDKPNYPLSSKALKSNLSTTEALEAEE